MTRYLLNTLFLTLALCSAVAVFNYIVDPYSIYHFENADTDRLSRVEQFYQMRLSKPWQVTQVKPTAVVVGTSRSGSIRPTHPSWAEQPSFNLSVPGMTPYELLRFIEHAQAKGPLDKLLIGLDFEAFIIADPHTRNGFAEFRMARVQETAVSMGSAWQRVLDMADTLLSTDTLAVSLSAVSGTGIPGRRYHRDGSWEKASSLLTGRSGYIYIGRDMVNRNREQALDLHENMAILGDILRFCHQQGIDTRLFITPQHVFLVDLWFDLGYQELWLEFHQALIAVNSAVALEMGREPLPLWGFNGLAGIVDEAIVERAHGLQGYFLDGLHFQDNFAQIIMDAVWGESTGAGTRLEAGNLVAYTLRVQQLSQQFTEKNQILRAELREKMQLPARSFLPHPAHGWPPTQAVLPGLPSTLSRLFSTAGAGQNLPGPSRPPRGW